MSPALGIRVAASKAQTVRMLLPVEILGGAGEWRHRTEAPLGARISVEVPEGQFLVRVVLPSGTVLCTGGVAEDDLEVELELPQEFPVLQAPWRFRQDATPWTPRLAAPWEDDESSGLAVAWIRLWDYGRTGKWDPKPDLPLGHRVEHLPGSPGAPVLVSVEFESAPRRPYWIQVGGTRCPHKFVALPPGGRTSFLVVQRAAADHERDPLWIVTESGDPQADIVLGYMVNCLRAEARWAVQELVREAQRSPRSAILQPHALLVAGYAVLQCGSQTVMADQQNWIPALYRRHSWSSDAAVIYAWTHLRSRAPDPRIARASLLEAVRRGVPQYTIGLRLLFDGLDLLHELGQRRDEEVATARRVVSSYVHAADLESIMTSFYAKLPDGPDAQWVWGPPGRGDPPAIEIGRVREPQCV